VQPNNAGPVRLAPTENAPTFEVEKESAYRKWLAFLHEQEFLK
jgi:hypothetical protein